MEEKYKEKIESSKHSARNVYYQEEGRNIVEGKQRNVYVPNLHRRAQLLDESC